MNASTPAERLNIAFRFGNSGITSKSGRIKARYSTSRTSPLSGQMRTSRSGSCAAHVSRHICALPIIRSRLTISSAIFFSLIIRGAAVDVDRLAGDEAAVVADQEQAGGGDLVDMPLPRERDAAGVRLVVAVPFGIVAPRVDAAGRD